jgi:hypothetical protein
MIIETSTLSLGERAFLTASFRSMIDKSFQCEKEWSDYADRTSSSNDEVKKFFKQSKGCFGGVLGTLRKTHGAKKVDTGLEIGGLKFNTCLCNFKHPNINYFATIFFQFNKHGTLPFEGPITNQPNKIMEIFDVMSLVMSEYESEEYIKQQAKNK